MINEKILSKYSILPFEKFKMQYDNVNENSLLITYYLEFLNETDYLAMKLAEGLITKEDKRDEFEARQFCRDEINRLSKEVITDKE